MSQPSFLHTRLPSLDGRMPWQRICNTPSPVQHMAALGNRAGMQSLYVKRDELLHPNIGGGVVRKLEPLLGDAEARDASLLIHHGPLGSEFSSALAVHAPPLGFKSDYLAYVRETSDRSRRYSKEAEALGLQVERGYFEFGAWARAKLRGYQPGRPRKYVIPKGGGPRGAVAFVNAALELSEQIKAGQLPTPTSIFLPTDTGAAVAGLAIGLHLAGIQCKIVGVAVTSSWSPRTRTIRSLIDRTVAVIRSYGCREVVPPDHSQYMLLRGFSGGTEHRVNQAAKLAVELARDTERLHLAPQRSGKVLSAILDQALSQKNFRTSNVLFWNTSADR